MVFAICGILSNIIGLVTLPRCEIPPLISDNNDLHTHFHDVMYYDKAHYQPGGKWCSVWALHHRRSFKAFSSFIQW